MLFVKFQFPLIQVSLWKYNRLLLKRTYYICFPDSVLYNAAIAVCVVNSQSIL